jgi:hypothetical protein
MSAEEPLYCPLCGAEDFGCECDLEGPFEKKDIRFCETCGAERPGGDCPECLPL